VVQVADVHGRRRIGARLLDRVREQPRIGLLDAPLVRIQQVIEPLGEVEPIEQVPEPPIGV